MAKRRRTKMLQLDWYGDDFLRIVDERGQEALQAAAEYVLAEALRRVPRKSGDLAESAYWATSKKSTWRKLQFGQKKAKRVPNDRTIVFGFAARHSHLVEKKVKRHDITPRRRRGGQAALNVYSYGKIRRTVHHPGNRPQKFFGPAVEASREAMVAAIAKSLRVNLARELPEGPR